MAKLRQEYVFIPAKVKEVYLFHLLGQLKELGVRSAIIFASTCKARRSARANISREATEHMYKPDQTRAPQGALFTPPPASERRLPHVVKPCSRGCEYCTSVMNNMRERLQQHMLILLELQPIV